MARQEGRRTKSRPSAGRALLWTAGSVLLPGLAHLRMGRRVSGWTMLITFLVLLATGLVTWVMLNGDIARSARIVSQGRWLLTIGAAAFLIAVLWMTIVVHSWFITTPQQTGRPARILSGALVVLLCLTIAAPAAAVMRTAYTAYDTLSSVFVSDGASGEESHDADNPWNGQERVNVLLLGGDSGSNRYGLRTDSMMAASIDIEHGDVVLVGIPRNLEDVQFPEGSKLAEAYPPPEGYDGLLNDVYQTVAEDPEKFAEDPDAADPAADTLKSVIGHITDIDLDYYALVDMEGFEGLIDAIGGIDVQIEEPIPYGQQGDILEAGKQHLDGNEALWYGRSRVQSSDYARMGRQGCLLKYVAEQANPTTVLSSFQDLAGATKKTLRTDIPQSKASAFIELADYVANEGDMKTLQLSPPQVQTAYPDWKEIKRLVAEALQEQEDQQSRTDEDVTPDEEAEDGSDSPEGSEAEQAEPDSADPSPTTPGRQVGDEADSLDELCPS